MVRELKKASRGPEGLEELERDCDETVKAVHAQREKDFGAELDTGFYFSVVFDTREERDKWLGERGIKLVEDFFVRIENFRVQAETAGRRQT